IPTPFSPWQASDHLKPSSSPVNESKLGHLPSQGREILCESPVLVRTSCGILKFYGVQRWTEARPSFPEAYLGLRRSSFGTVTTPRLECKPEGLSTREAFFVGRALPGRRLIPRHAAGQESKEIRE
ncbi:MAG TPA: hypothetical protein PK954_05675, partial [Anaerolineales bacterium]|nr:hypothetical protein [Anaerolineales bacterium]